jgi:hypothetical protein
MRDEVRSGRPMWQRVLTGALQAVPLAGCGGGAHAIAEPASSTPSVQVASAQTTRATDASPAQPAKADAEPAETSSEALPVAEGKVPNECVAGSEPCDAPAKFVEQVCRGKYQDLALSMHAKGTPWRRGYVKVEKLEPVNIYAGERSEEWLRFGEEVLILRTRGPGGGGGVQVSGPTDVDVLRWDGTCATVRQEMLAQYPTNTTIATPRIAWKYLATPTQEALVANGVVKHYSEKERPACRGSTMKSPDAACDKASRKLTDAITVALRGGLVLPTPAKLPVW